MGKNDVVAENGFVMAFGVLEDVFENYYQVPAIGIWKVHEDHPLIIGFDLEDEYSPIVYPKGNGKPLENVLNSGAPEYDYALLSVVPDNAKFPLNFKENTIFNNSEVIKYPELEKSVSYLSSKKNANIVFFPNGCNNTRFERAAIVHNMQVPKLLEDYLRFNMSSSEFLARKQMREKSPCSYKIGVGVNGIHIAFVFARENLSIRFYEPIKK